MPWRKWDHRNRVWSKWGKTCRSNLLAPASDLLFLSTETWFLLSEMTSLIPPVVFEHLRYSAQLVPCSNKDPTHMSILRCSKVWWARSHHSQSVQLPSNRLNEGLLGRKRAISEVYKLFAFLLLHTKIIEKRDSKGGGKAHEPSSNILDHTEQFAPYPVDPSAHPKVGEFVGGIKKRTRVLVPSITSCLSHQLPNLQSWPHGPEEDSHLNRWFLFSTQPQRLEEGKQL